MLFTVAAVVWICRGRRFVSVVAGTLDNPQVMVVLHNVLSDDSVPYLQQHKLNPAVMRWRQVEDMSQPR